ncbi:hypothetical protein K2173_026382 [Erythroxylum novogranatense]|uniref:SPARK domain-containing protein n=1 Tax=Erythroxylum novogranatense TaxID=1862640 RepID=A0AAV8SNW5_9ROSI|nr:hypothetical protein K2173_026382 [Erythroxylum novogranatense]
MTLPSNFFFIFPFFVIFPTSLVLGLPDPDPVNVQSFLPARSPPATIPAFPEQSNVAGCPLDLPDELLQGIESACGSGNGGHGQLQKTRCCPVLAAWLYYAYSGTALGRAEGVAPVAGGAPPSSFDNLPLLPDDSETCVDTLGKALRKKGMELIKPNETCDLVYCYCGIRLHPLSCPEAFSLNQKGKLVGEKGVKRLERDCLSSSSNVDGFPGLGGCSNCLNSLYLLVFESSKVIPFFGQLNCQLVKLNNKSSSSSKSEDRATKMRNKDCQLMGLTWLLAKNRTAYIHTVSNVLRAMMLNRDGSDPHTCALNSDGMPLAVDSSEISNSSCSITKELASSSVHLFIAFIYLLHKLL